MRDIHGSLSCKDGDWPVAIRRGAAQTSVWGAERIFVALTGAPAQGKCLTVRQQKDAMTHSLAFDALDVNIAREANLPDISSCECEPIAFPGAIQPHGALLVVHASSGVVEGASTSCLSLLGWEPAALLGQPVGSLLGAQAAQTLLAEDSEKLGTLVALTLGRVPLGARAQRNASGQWLIDIEPTSPPDSADRFVRRCRQIMAAQRLLPDPESMANHLVAALRALTGLDRVMLYRFDADWNGEVIAEARAEHMEPYLGLHFPASDIPAQARALFKSSGVRQISDVLYQPSALLCAGSAKAIDLGKSSLRSVSPMHIEYLAHMQVRSTLVGSLIVDGELWGLVSCQHRAGPRYFAALERDALGGLCEDVGTLMEGRLLRQRRERELDLAMRRRRLVEKMRACDFKTLMQQADQRDLLSVVNADGFALQIDDVMQATHCTPTAAQMVEIHRRWRARVSDSALFSSSALQHDLAMEAIDGDVAGVLCVSLPGKPEMTLCWFRREQARVTVWGGNADQPHDQDDQGRISPRKSFAQYLTTIRGKCLPWTPEELSSAAELGSLIEIELLREREAFAQTILNSMPAHMAVLDRGSLWQGAVAAHEDISTRKQAEGWLTQRLDEQIAILASDLVGFVKIRDRVILWSNHAFNAMLGYADGELKGATTRRFFASQDAYDRFAATAYAAMQSTGTYRVRTQMLRKDGRMAWFALHYGPLPSHGGEFIGVLIDISEQIKAEMEQQELMTRLHQIANLVPGMLFKYQVRADGKSAFAYASGAIQDIYRLRPDDVRDDASPARERIHPDDLAAFEASIQASARDLTLWVHEYRLAFVDGTQRWLRGNAMPQQEADGSVVWHGFISDITERKQVEEELAIHRADVELGVSRQRLRELVVQNERERELERKSVAREIHDELGQVLTGLRMRLLLMELRYCALDPGLPQLVADMKGLLDRGIRGVRDVVMHLRPTTLDLGLRHAIEALCTECASSSGMTFTLDLTECDCALDEMRAVVVYRIAQESITNAIRHARASTISVTLGADNAMVLEVGDNGRGFEAGSARLAHSFGLLGMRERAIALGGQLEIESAPQQGTTVRLTIPCSHSVEAVAP